MHVNVRYAATMALLFCFVWPGTAVASQSDEATLRHLKEVVWPKAYAEQDVKRLDTILAPEFRRVDADGNWFTKQDELERLRTTKPAYDSLVFTIKRLEVFENGTAIVAGEGTVRGKDRDGAYVMTYQSTNVLIKRNGEWKAISSHVSGRKRVAVAT